MKDQLQTALSRHAKLAFRRIRPGAELIRRIHRLPEALRNDIHLRTLQEWLVVPFSLWPVDVIGIANYVVGLAESGGQPSVEIRTMIEILGAPPTAKTCDSICAHEHHVKGGNYESLIKAQHKFDAKEVLLIENEEFVADWKWIKKHFDVSKHLGDTGVIRRRMVSERNFHPPDWDFAWATAKDQFENVFDAFCHKWVLYGMERDKPLLQKLSVNITPYGTMIVIPRYWSLDCNRDLKWGAITRLHHSRGVPRQGAKLAANLMQRRAQAKSARKYLTEAKRQGLKGDAKTRWVMAKLGMHPDTDAKQLRRLVKIA